MKLRLVDSPEPLTEAADGGKEVILADSDASRQLARILRRYLERKIPGRTVLISGHRGSGKTTLVRKVVQEVREELRQRTNRRPLLVLLHGPDLLPNRVLLPRPGASRPETGPEDRQRVLKRITAGLYRALGRELSRAFRDRLKEKAIGTSGTDDLAELAAHFELALDGSLNLEDLRDFWRRAGSLPKGILFPKSDPTAGRGPLEIVALASAARAYRRISGREESQFSKSKLRHREEERSRSVNISSPELLRTLVGLFTATALGVAVTGYPLAGVVAAVAALATGSFSLRRKGTDLREIEEKSLFFPDTSPATLERELPVLVDRLHDAGLSPVFVIDELDKVDHLRPRLEAVIHHLKHLASAGVFFCFLTDRDYFEEVCKRSPGAPYPREHTYFSDRLFVIHRPQDLRDYLMRAIAVDERPGSRMARGMLTYTLLCRFCLHPVDLRRELRRLAGPGGVLDVDADAIRSRRGDRYAATYQLAVELTLDQPETRERLALDPGIVQALYDTLYYPFRKWMAGKRELKVRKKVLRRYLRHRRHPPESHSRFRIRTLSSLDLDFLLRVLRELVDRLCDLPGLRSESDSLSKEIAGDPRVSYAIRSAIPNTEKGGDERELRLLEEVSNNPPIFRWCVDPYGLPYFPSDAGSEDQPEASGLGEAPTDGGAPEELPLGEMLKMGRLLEKLDTFIFDCTEALDLEELATKLLFLSPVPSWRHVKTVRRRLEGAEEPSDTDRRFQEERQILEDYLKMMERRSRSLERSLVLGALAGQAYVGGSPKSRFIFGLEAVAHLLRPASQRSERDFDRALDTLEASLPKENPLPELTRGEKSPFLAGERFQAWRDSFEKWREELPAIPPTEELQEQAWESWDKALKRFLVSGGDEAPTLWEHLVTAAAKIPPGNLLRSPIDQLSLEEWTQILHLAFREKTGVPRWMAAPALAFLGFGAHLEKSCEALRAAHRGDLDGPLDAWTLWLSMNVPELEKARPTAVVVAANKESMTEGWTPSEDNGALLFSWNQHQGRESLRPFAARPPGQAHILLIEASDDSSRIDGLVKAWHADQATALLVPDFDFPTKEGRDLPRVVAPASLDEAMEAALSQLATKDR